ncbi:MAG: NAD(P)/FAD-dependent oxidoreductase [Peptococcaceae bacterium]|jgi:thioredoxin reductase (NADPH)|nr:NAD(P)/FAD-dependent oxidoreductase [Peptococcaceae bacterium]
MDIMEIYDIAIVGCGPAGLSAAINAASRKKSTLLLGEEVCSPKLLKSPHINNYLGLPEIKGSSLRDKFMQHVSLLNIPILPKKVESISRNEDGIFLLNARDEAYYSRTIIIATGVTVTQFVKGERDYVGKGVSYCATCDGILFAGQQVAVLDFTGEGIEEANFLAEICSKVYYINGSGLDKQGLKDTVEVVDGKVNAIAGDEFVTEIKVGERILPVDGLFIFRETYLPEQLIAGLETKDNHIIVDRSCQTNIAGVYAAGDCTGKPYQVAKAVGEGQIAALNAVQYLDQ